MRPSILPVRPAAALLAALALAAPAHAERLLDFAQFDASSASRTLVLVRALGDVQAAEPAPIASATYTAWSDGSAGALGVVQRWPVAAAGGHALTLGAGAGVNDYASHAPGNAEHRSGASLRAQAEADGPAPGGRYYALAQASSFRGGWFASGQYTLAGAAAGVELSRYGEDGYHATTAALRIGLGVAGWSLRLGAVHDDDGRRGFVGIAYNGF